MLGRNGTFPRSTTPLVLAVALCGIAPFAVPAAVSIAAAQQGSQQTTTAAIADSPTAQTLIGDIRTQAKENPAESARIARRLLDEYGNRVVRVGAETDDLFKSVSEETERFLLENPTVLARFRDMELRAAERMLLDEGPAAAAARRRLTPAGLAATLILAERALRADQPLEALALLAKVRVHPDLNADSTLALATLESMALRRTGDAKGADAALARIDTITGIEPAAAESARAAARRTERSAGSALGRTPLTTADEGGDPDDTWREIWSLELDQSLFKRIYGGLLSARSQRDIERARSEARLMAAVPTVLGNRVYISEGHRVRAIDIDSRDEVWSRDIGGASVGREGAPIGDLSAIAVDPGILVAYEGHATSSERTASPRVWCLDPATGAQRWNAVVDGCDSRADLAGLFPVGAPILVSDVVVVAARKPTQRLEQVDWLLALDRTDGHLRWATSVAGAPANRLSTGRKHAALATDGAVVIDSTPLGAIVCVRANDGGIEWLRRFPVPLREPRYFAEPWECAAPAIAGNRVLTLTPDELEVVALDRASGRLLEARPIGPETEWAEPLYLVSATASDGTPIVLGVGSDIVAFDARDLSKRLWSLAATTRDINPPRAATGNRNGIRGRVSVAGQFVVVPGVQEILLLDLATGRVNARVPTGQPCNPLLLGDRIVASGDDALRVIMPSERAESMLRARLASTPNDPSAAIALLELAQATGRPKVALDAARTAEEALARGHGNEPLRGELIDKLVALAAQSPEQGNDAFSVIAKVASTPSLRVRGEMARGEYLRSAGRAGEAVACWRQVAADPQLNTQIMDVQGVGRQVRIEALARVAQLGSRDRELAAALESDARAAVEKLGPGPGVAALARLAELHPRTQSLVDAISAASDLKLAEATALSAAAIEDCLIPPARADLIDALRADLARRSDDRGHAARLAAIDHRIAGLLHASGIDRRELERVSPPLAKVGTAPTVGFDIRARLVGESATARESHDRSLILGLQEGALVRLAGPELAPAWRLRLDDREPILLWANKRAVLWQSLPKGEDNALIVDPAAGTILYASPKAADLWPMAGGVPVEPPPDFNRPQKIAAMPALVAPVCDGESLILVRRNGDLARVGVMDERPTPILARGVIEQVVCEGLRDGLLAIGGRETTADGQRGVVAVFDARTLEPRVRIEPQSSAEVSWVYPTALGEVFIGTRMGIERWFIGPSGSALPTLVSILPESTESARPNLLGGQLFTLDGAGRPTLLPIFAGNPRTYAYPDAAESRQLRDILPLRDGLLLQADDRFVLLGPTGDTIGVDSNSREPNLAFAVPVDGALLQIVALQPDADAGKLRYLAGCVIERLSLAQGLRNLGGAFEVKARDSRVNRVLAADGWLLLSNSQGTMAVALPP